jgi:thioredoxin-related protein
MMKKKIKKVNVLMSLIAIIGLSVLLVSCNQDQKQSQETQKKDEAPKATIYNPQANAEDEIGKAVAQAKTENKNVLIQVGGNWCSWCVRMHKLMLTDTKLDSMIKANYIYILVNYSKENKNLPVMQKLDYPQRFGFPVFVVLNQSGVRIHTQDTGLLEKDKGYDNEKIKTFLRNWTVKALSPENYVMK